MSTSMGDYTEILIRQGTISPDQLAEAEAVANQSANMSVTEALTRLLRHRDYWVAASAATLAGELEGAPLEAELASLKEHPSKIVREAVEKALSNNSY